MRFPKVSIKTSYWDNVDAHKMHWQLTFDTVFYAAIAIFVGGTLSWFIWAYVILRLPAIISYNIWTKRQKYD